MKVLSYNIHKGFTFRNTEFVLGKIRESIRASGADLVFLQEVLGEHSGHAARVKDWPSVSQFEYLADSVWTHHAYGKNAVYDEGHHGNALLSKFPISFWENVDISTNRFEQRGMLHAKIEVPDHGKSVHAFSLHFGLFESGRRLQVGRLCERVKEHVGEGEPLVIAGDFNDWREKATGMLEEGLGMTEVFANLQGRHAKTFPSSLPILRLDRIYCRGFRPKSVNVFRGEPWSDLSDHLPVFSELEFEIQQS